MKPLSRFAGRGGVFVAGLVLVLVVAGCGGDETSGTVPTTTAIPTTTVSTTTTTSAPATATAPPTSAATTTVTAPPTGTETTAAVPTTLLDTNTLAARSGCTPGTDELGDGEWFGFVDAASATTIEFDLACWFAGDAAVLAAAEDGEESPPPNDYHVRNVNPRLRTLSVAPDVLVSWLPIVGDPSTQETVEYGEWLSGRDARGPELQPGVWITMASGEAVSVSEQYVP